MTPTSQLQDQFLPVQTPFDTPVRLSAVRRVPRGTDLRSDIADRTCARLRQQIQQPSQVKWQELADDCYSPPLAQYQARRRDAGARGYQHMLDVVHLIDRRTPKLAYPFGNAVHPMDVRLTQLAAVS